MGLVTFLLGVGILAGSGIKSSYKRELYENERKKLGLNLGRQIELKKLAKGSNSLDCKEMVELLESVDVTQIKEKTIDRTVEELQKEKEHLISCYKKYYLYNKYKKVHKPLTEYCLSEGDVCLAVWFISAKEGWTYDKSDICDKAPYWCKGHDDVMSRNYKQYGRFTSPYHWK